MAKIKKLDDQREGDRLAAYLALAATEQPEAATGQPETEDGCLSADRLADVAAGCCSAEERKAALAHFSSCRKCYDAWVAVCFSLAAVESGSQGRKRSSGAIRGLAYLGSAFAVAASVVVFLNIRNTAVEPGLMAPAPTVRENFQQVLPDQREDSLRQREIRAEEERIEPAAPPAAMKTSEPGSEPPSVAKKKEAGQGSITEESAPHPGAEAEMASPSAGTAGTVDLAADSAGQARETGAAEWISRVETVCRDGHYLGDLPGWNALQAEGGRILETESDAGRLPLLTAIVRIMEVAEESAEVEGQCRRILELIAKERD